MNVQGAERQDGFPHCKYQVRKLEQRDIEAVYGLCQSNPQFYEFHPPFVTRESILEDMAALPPGKTMADKYFMGFWKEGVLVAILDLIVNYPRDRMAYIGLFMTDAVCQNRGVGSEIIQELASALTVSGFDKIRLAIDEGNPQSEAFWLKNHFVKTGEIYPSETSSYFPMERSLNKVTEKA